MSKRPLGVTVRNTCEDDFTEIVELSAAVYPDVTPWAPAQLHSHLRVFPEGQFVAVATDTQRVVGMAASLIVTWDDYDIDASWRSMTDRGTFSNHDPEGHTLYGAEVMVHPSVQRRGIGRHLYAARKDLTRRLGLKRIRAGARLRGYHRYASSLTPEEYVINVVRRDIKDPTLSFQLKAGFRVIAVVSDYLQHDPDSLGHAAVIEWLNHEVVKRSDYKRRDPRFIDPPTHERGERDG